MRVTPSALLLALLLLPGLTSCTYVQGDNSLYLTSEPPGAHIALNGLDTGFTTPHKLDLMEYGKHDHVVTLSKKGYVTEKRFIHLHRQNRTSRWSDGAVADLNLAWPIFWTLGDFFTPFEYRWEFVPNTVHVDLWPQGRAPVKSEVLVGNAQVNPAGKTGSPKGKTSVQ